MTQPYSAATAGFTAASVLQQQQQQQHQQQQHQHDLEEQVQSMKHALIATMEEVERLRQDSQLENAKLQREFRDSVDAILNATESIDGAAAAGRRSSSGGSTAAASGGAQQPAPSASPILITTLADGSLKQQANKQQDLREAVSNVASGGMMIGSGAAQQRKHHDALSTLPIDANLVEALVSRVHILEASVQNLHERQQHHLHNDFQAQTQNNSNNNIALESALTHTAAFITKADEEIGVLQTEVTDKMTMWSREV